MSLLMDWLRQVNAGHGDAPLLISDEENELHGLSLRDVLQAHKDWRAQLELDLDSERLRNLDAGSLARDDLCTLGKWLHGPGRERFGHHPSWAAACRVHAEFHQCAGELLRARRRNEPAEALTNLGYRLRDASSRNQLELVRLFTSAHR
jgi:hypothetical protein